MKTLRVISASLFAASLGFAVTAQAVPTSASIAANFEVSAVVTDTLLGAGTHTLTITPVQSFASSSAIGDTGGTAASGAMVQNALAATVAGASNTHVTVTATEGMGAPSTLVFEAGL